MLICFIASLSHLILVSIFMLIVSNLSQKDGSLSSIKRMSYQRFLEIMFTLQLASKTATSLDLVYKSAE